MKFLKIVFVVVMLVGGFFVFVGVMVDDFVFIVMDDFFVVKKLFEGVVNVGYLVQFGNIKSFLMMVDFILIWYGNIIVWLLWGNVSNMLFNDE